MRLDWPALEPPDARPAVVEFERGIWGKVHGSVVDFGWIGRTAGFDRAGERIERHFVLGAENVLPPRTPFWRPVGSRYVGASCYPSAAVDAARRRGLEKQFLASERKHSSAALAAFLLLPAAARLDTGLWLDARGLGHGQAAATTTIPSSDALAVDELSSAIARGLDGLRDRFSKRRGPLIGLYESLLAHQRPAVLSGLPGPLEPDEFAALLLPLPRERANELSLAGWIIPSSWNPRQLAGSWDVIVCEAPLPWPPRARRELEGQRAWGAERAAEMVELLLDD